MDNFFRKLFNVYPGEEKKALLFGFLGFLWAIAASSGLKFADALFLLHVGADSLPITYKLTSCLMIGLAIFLLYAFHHIPAHRIFLGVISSGIVFYLATYFYLSSEAGRESDFIWYALRIYGSLFFAVVVTCFWTFIDQFHHLQDAKRLYSLFSSMVFLGVAVTGVVMHSGMIDFRNLTLVIVALLIGVIYWIFKIVREVSPVHDENETEGAKGQEDFSLKKLIVSILSSRFTLLLMVGNFLGYLLMVVTEFNYMSSFQSYFASQDVVPEGSESEARLTQFLGQCLATVSITNLIFGLFIYSRLVRRFGIGSMLVITPAILVITFTGWPMSNTLLFPLLGYFVVEGTLYVIDDSNFTLLLNAVPTKLKHKIRVCIESFLEPIGMLVSASLISLAPEQSKYFGLLMAITWLVVALILRKLYPRAIYRNLAENAIHFDRPAKEWFSMLSKKEKRSCEHRLLAILRQGEEESQIFASDSLIRFEDSAIINKFLREADNLSPHAKIEFIKQLGNTPFGREPHIIDHLRSWSINDTDPNLKGEIYLYLAKLGLSHPDKAWTDYQNADLKIKGGAILSLMKSSATLPSHEIAENYAFADKQIHALLASNNDEEICMGLHILGCEASPVNVDLLVPFLKHSSTKVQRQAAASLAEIIDSQSERYGPQLIQALSESRDNEFRLNCLKALGKLKDSSLAREIIYHSDRFRPNERRSAEGVISSMGLRNVPMLLAMTKDQQLPDRCRLLAGRILGKIALPQLRANLYGILRTEVERAYFYYYHAQTVQKEHPQLDLKILREALLSDYHSVLDFIMQMLGTAGEIEDSELLSRSIRSKQPKVRSQVVETLEKTCEPAIFRLIAPLVSESPHEEQLNAYIRGGGEPLNLEDLLARMSASPTLGDQIVAATLRYRLNLPEWRGTLKKQMEGSTEIFHHFGYELLDA